MADKGFYDNPALQATDEVDLNSSSPDAKPCSSGDVEPQSQELRSFQPSGKTDAVKGCADHRTQHGTLEIGDTRSSGISDPEDGCTRLVVVGRRAISRFYTANRRQIRMVIRIVLLILYHAYLISAIHFSVVFGDGIEFCDGVGFLIIVTAIVYLGVLYSYVLVPYLSSWAQKTIYVPTSSALGKAWSIRMVRIGAGLATLCAIFVYLVVDTSTERTRLTSALGAVVFVLLSWFFSKYPGRVIWRHVFWGLGLQLVFGIVILRWQVGRSVFECGGDKVKTFLDYTTEGSKFVFGFLADEDGDFVFAVSILPVVIFFSFCIQILYYYGIMQWVVVKLGWLLQVTVGTTACESLNAAANIFVGPSEAPLLVRPFLTLLTMSELHAIMTGGFATIAGSVLAAYIKFDVSATHLLTASVMSAPAALAVSKLVYPETERTKTSAGDIHVEKGAEVNALDAASHGAMSAVKICGYIAASLIGFIAFISFVNGLLGWAGDLVGFQQNLGFPLTFQYLASLLLSPVALLMGVPWKDCGLVGELIGFKVVLNEFVAYSKLRDMIRMKKLSQRGITIATYALCGFSNFASIGIQISGIAAMAPSRKADLARLALSAMICGNIACFLTACIAGTLIGDSSTVVSAIASAIPQNATTTMAT